jgi:hypothetical protein
MWKKQDPFSLAVAMCGLTEIGFGITITEPTFTNRAVGKNPTATEPTMWVIGNTPTKDTDGTRENGGNYEL